MKKPTIDNLESVIPDEIDLFRIIRSAGRSNIAKAQMVNKALDPIRRYCELMKEN